MPDFTFSARTGRFRGPNGRFLTARQVRAIIDRTLDTHTRAIDTLTEQLRERAITLGEWERRMRVEIKGIHLYSAMAAKGGRQGLTPRDLGSIGATVKRQYRFLRRFADQVEKGRQPVDGRLVSRARLYAQAGRGSYEATRQREMRRRGFTEERNVLGLAEHCEGDGSCTQETARGWVPIATLIPIGGRLCVANCRCSIQYRDPETGEMAA